MVRIVEVDDIDHPKPRREQWHVIVHDLEPGARDEMTCIAERGSLGPHAFDNFAGTSPYLNDLDFRFVVNNALDKMPPFMYRIGANLGNPAAFDISLSTIGRQWTFVVTKTW